MTVKHKNRKEDFKLLISLGDNYNGEDFRIIFSTSGYGSNTFECSFIDGVYTNCEKVDDSHVLCKFDNHRLPSGVLTAEKRFIIPDPSMPDGNYVKHEKSVVVFTDEQGKEFHVELWDGETDHFEISEVTFEMLTDVIKGDPFTYDDFTEKQIEDLKKPATDAAETADAAAEAAVEATEAATAATALANEAAETATGAASTATEAAETAATAAETANTAASSANEAAESANEAAESANAAAETASTAAGSVDASIAAATAATEAANAAADAANEAAERASQLDERALEKIGNLNNLETTEKSNLVGAINEVLENRGAGSWSEIKPAGGVPASDLSSEVQTSLNKANTAIQQHQSLDGKQDVISDLDSIRSGAALGATAIQEHQSLDGLQEASTLNNGQIQIKVGNSYYLMTGTQLVAPDAPTITSALIQDATATTAKDFVFSYPSGAAVHYTDDGTEPTTSSPTATKYSLANDLTKKEVTKTLKLRSRKNNMWSVNTLTAEIKVRRKLAISLSAPSGDRFSASRTVTASVQSQAEANAVSYTCSKSGTTSNNAFSYTFTSDIAKDGFTLSASAENWVDSAQVKNDAAWEVKHLHAPSISLSTYTAYSEKTTVTLTKHASSDSSEKLQYKIGNGDWTDYTAAFDYKPTVSESGTAVTIYARTTRDGWTPESSNKSIAAIARVCMYKGLVQSAPTTLDGLTAVEANTLPQSYAITTSGQVKVCFAYRKSLGALTSIKDANGTQYIGDFTRTEVTYKGISFYVYTMNKLGDQNGMTYTFSK